MKRGYAADPWFAHAPNANTKAAGLSEHDGLWLTKNDQVAVPDVPGLRQGILYELHDLPCGGHAGVRKTREAVKSLYWWPNMRAQIEEYVQTCASCQRNKPLNVKPSGVLQPLRIPRDRWSSVSMDFITQLPTATGPIPYDAIVVFVDSVAALEREVPASERILPRTYTSANRGENQVTLQERTRSRVLR